MFSINNAYNVRDNNNDIVNVHVDIIVSIARAQTSILQHHYLKALMAFEEHIQACGRLKKQLKKWKDITNLMSSLRDEFKVHIGSTVYVDDIMV